MALDDLPTLERVARLKLLPPVHGADLNTDHVLVALVRLKVTNALCLLDPGVPHYGIYQVVTDYVKARLAILEDRSGVLLDVLVDPIGLAGNADRRVGLCLLAGVLHLVEVGGAAKAIDLELGDVL